MAGSGSSCTRTPGAATPAPGPIGLFGDVETLVVGRRRGSSTSRGFATSPSGWRLDGVYAMKASSFGWTLYPTVRYTF